MKHHNTQNHCRDTIFKGKKIKCTLKQVLKYKYISTEVGHTASVPGCADQTTGKYKNWYSPECIEPNNSAGSTKSVDILYSWKNFR